MSDKIYVIGHKSPDLDSVAAAIALAKYRNEIENCDTYEAAIAGEANKETVYLLAKCGLPMPTFLSDLAGKRLILVDHNEAMQSADGVEAASIISILDHHKLDFRYAEPIAVDIRPWGSSCSIVADLYFKAGLAISQPLATLMLGAVLVDTVITKSPTVTEIDKEIIGKLSGLAGIEDWQAFGMEIFKVRSDISDLSDEAIIRSDYKDFAMKEGKFGIGQVETADLSAFADREEGLIARLGEMRQAGDYHSVIIFLTDIIEGGSLFLVASKDQAKVEEALGAKLENGRVYLPGIMSRKKQVAPMFSQVFDK
jgi:manganese-dependent inorganic pyrophosphatase